MSDPVPTINLIPLPRRIRRARRLATGRWLLACGFVALASLAPAGAMGMASGSRSDGVGDRVARAERAIAQLKAEEPVLKKQLAELQKTDTILRVIEDRPVWLPLLGALSSASGAARFERIEAEMSDGPDRTVSVQFSALVPTQTDGRDFVLRLESLGVFDSVMLRSSTRVGLAGADVVRCDITAKFRLGKTP